MHERRMKVAKDVASRLFAAETALDIAAARLAELTAAMPIARIDAHFAAAIGQEAFASSADALALLAKVRERVVATHASLKQASDEAGLEAISYGDSLKAPKAHGFAAEPARLRAAS